MLSQLQHFNFVVVFKLVCSRLVLLAFVLIQFSRVSVAHVCDYRLIICDWHCDYRFIICGCHVKRPCEKAMHLGAKKNKYHSHLNIFN